MIKKWICGLLLLLVAGSLGCRPKKAENVSTSEPLSVVPPDDVIVMVNQEPIYADELKATIQRFSQGRPSSTEKADKSRVVLQSLNYILMRRLWAQQFMAQTSPPVSPEEIQAAQEKFETLLPRRQTLEDSLAKEGLSYPEFRMNLLLNLYRAKTIEQLHDSIPSISPEDIQTYFDTQMRSLDVPESVEGSQIEISSKSVGKETKEARAAEAWQHLQDGRSFADVAWLYSDHPNRADEGRMGRIWRGRTQNIRLENALFALKPGECSDVIKDGDSLYILKVDAYFPSETYTLEEAQEQVRKILTNQALQEALREFQMDMLKKANIEFFGNAKPLEKAYWAIYYPELHSTSAEVKSDERPAPH